MLRSSYAPMLSDQDQLIFNTLVPADHYLRQVNTLVDFERYRGEMATCYHASDGRPADDPVLLLKLGFLQTHYNLSDREVMAAAQVNVAFRYFLNLALSDPLCHPSLLTVFRARLGARRARYRGRARSRIQYLLIGLVVNVKRMVRLLLRPAQGRERCALV